MFIPVYAIVLFLFLGFWILTSAYATYLDQYPKFKFEFDYYYRYDENTNTYVQTGNCPRTTGVKDVILTFLLYLIIPRVCSIIKQAHLSTGTFNQRS